MGNGIYYNSPIGNLWIEEEQGSVVQITKTENLISGTPTQFLQKVQKELEEYFMGDRKEFTFPIQPKGTEFQKEVWRALQKIPYGKVKSYSDIAEYIKKPKAYRAVGNACNKNPILIVIPCHRVIGKNKELTGFALGLEVKERLLRIEKTEER